MFDLPYIATHPLLAEIMKHCAQHWQNKPDGLPPGSPARKKLDRRVSELEQYKLPKPDARDLDESEPILDSSGQQIGARHSLRTRFVPNVREAGPKNSGSGLGLHSRRKACPPPDDLA